MKLDMIIRKVPVTDIKPAEYSLRKELKPGNPAYKKLKRSMMEFGYVEPITWNEETGNIVGGHQRYKVLVAEGHTEVECVIVKMNAEREKALNVSLNKVTGDWEFEALADLIKDLEAQDFYVTFTGFDAAEIEDLISQVDDKYATDDDYDVNRALEEAAFVKPGDIWLLGRHRLMCGDAKKAEDVEKLMDGKKANLVLTDCLTMLTLKMSVALRFKTISRTMIPYTASYLQLLRIWQSIPHLEDQFMFSMRILKGLISERPSLK